MIVSESYPVASGHVYHSADRMSTNRMPATKTKFVSVIDLE